MTTRLHTRSTAFALAALVTLTLMAGIDGLAQRDEPAAGGTLAQGSAPVQVVVITGQRAPRS
jgi:hypothetical protein